MAVFSAHMARTCFLTFALLLLLGCGATETGPQTATVVPPSTDPVTSTTAAVTTTTNNNNTTTETSTSVADPAREPITLGFAGDTSFTNGLADRDPLGQIADLLRRPDLMVVNLETAVADPEVGRPFVDKRFLFKSPPDSLQLLVDAGVDVVALGNNHTLDYGPDALAQTLAELDAVGLSRVGAGLTVAEAYQPLLVDVGGWTVGLVSLSRVPCDWSAADPNQRPWVAWACPDLMDRAEVMVADAVDRADVTVVMVHGGTEGVLCPSDFMVELEQRWAELGADFVINGHPHVLQGITAWGETLAVHSTGNFAFPSASGLTANSAVFMLEVSEDGVELMVEPVRVPGGVASRPTDRQRQAIFDQINSVSSGWQLDPSGRAVPSDVDGDC